MVHTYLVFVTSISCSYLFSALKSSYFAFDSLIFNHFTWKVFFPRLKQILCTFFPIPLKLRFYLNPQLLFDSLEEKNEHTEKEHEAEKVEEITKDWFAHQIQPNHISIHWQYIGFSIDLFRFICIVYSDELSISSPPPLSLSIIFIQHAFFFDLVPFFPISGIFVNCSASFDILWCNSNRFGSKTILGMRACSPPEKYDSKVRINYTYLGYILTHSHVHLVNCSECVPVLTSHYSTVRSTVVIHKHQSNIFDS